MTKLNALINAVAMSEIAKSELESVRNIKVTWYRPILKYRRTKLVKELERMYHKALNLVKDAQKEFDAEEQLRMSQANSFQYIMKQNNLRN